VTRREIPLDAAEIFAALARHGVEYVLIGGPAVQAHGHVRTTQDADLVPSPDPGKRARLTAALGELGARPAGGAEPPPGWSLAEALEGGGTLSFDTDAGGVDVHHDPPGAAAFAALRERAMVLEIGGVAVVVAGRDDLIAMKRASGRPVDRGDVIALTRPEIG